MSPSEVWYSSIQFAMLWTFATAAGWFLSAFLISNLFLGLFLFPMVALSGSVPGTIVGLLQWWLLRSHVREASLWLFATILGSIISWQLVLYKYGTWATESGLWIGVIMSGCQVVVLWRWIKWHALIWMPISSIAWTIGWTLYSQGLTGQGFESFWNYAALAGVVVGILTGPALIWLLGHIVRKFDPDS